MFNSTSHIFLTGGTGFFGKALLRRLQDLGEDAPRVTVLSRQPERFATMHPDLANLVEWVSGDILDPTSLPFSFKFTHILHAATDSTLGSQLSPIERYEQIVDGTRNILDLAVKTGASRFLLTSSGAVYGSQPQWMNQIPEDYHGMPDPLNTENVYGIAKRIAENLCAIYQKRHGLSTVIARCFTFVGRDLPLDAHFAVGNFMRNALAGNDILVQGDGTPIRSYMDQEDMAHWLLTLLVRGRAGHAYNVGSDEAISIGTLAYTIRDLIAPSVSIKFMHASMFNTHRNIYIPSIQKAKEELRLELFKSLPEAIKNTIIYLKQKHSPN